MMTEEEYHRKRLVLAIVNHPDWVQLQKDVRSSIMEDMMLEKDANKRNDLYNEAQALDRLAGRMTGIANEVRREDTKRNTNAA